MHRCDFDQTSEPQSQQWTASTKNQENNVQNLFLFNSIKGGISLLLPVLHGGRGIKTGEAHSFFFLKNCCCRFVYSWWQLAATDGVCKQYTTHVTFFSCTACTFNDVRYHIGSSVGARGLFSPFFPHFVPSSFSLLSLLLLPEPWLLLFPLPCGLHRGKIPLSPALWPITRLSQVMSPTSSTISTTQRPLKSSSRSNPVTRRPRTCMTRRSVTRPSAERSLTTVHSGARRSSEP